MCSVSLICKLKMGSLSRDRRPDGAGCPDFSDPESLEIVSKKSETQNYFFFFCFMVQHTFFFLILQRAVNIFPCTGQKSVLKPRGLKLNNRVIMKASISIRLKAQGLANACQGHNTKGTPSKLPCGALPPPLETQRCLNSSVSPGCHVVCGGGIA